MQLAATTAHGAFVDAAFKSKQLALRDCVFTQVEEIRMIHSQQHTTQPIQRWSNALLIVVLLLPVLAIFGNGGPSDAALPSCCRAHGKHQCAIRTRMASTDAFVPKTEKPQIAKVSEHCPYSPTLPLLGQCNLSGKRVPSLTVIFVAAEELPCAVNSGQRSRPDTQLNPKRGPPVSRATA
jgi:hypothetical protein